MHVATGLDEKKLLAVRSQAAVAHATSDEVDEPADIMAHSGEIRVDEEEDWDPSLH